MILDFIGKYFKHASDYNTVDFGQGVIELDEFYWYVSSTFLNGLVNYVSPLRVFMLERYRTYDEERFRAAVGQNFHTNLKQFDDDILILAEPQKKHPERDESSGIRWVFWFDCDVSDCGIGRFFPGVSDEILCSDFEEWVRSLQLPTDSAAQATQERKMLEQDPDNCRGVEGITGYHEIPTSALNGWVSF